jgi:electron transport complex protein RnfE
MSNARIDSDVLASDEEQPNAQRAALRVYPLLALAPVCVSPATLLEGMILGCATTLILLIGTCCTILVIRHTPARVRLSVIAFISGAIIVCVALTMSAWTGPVYHDVGAYLPLLTTGFLCTGFTAERIRSLRRVLKPISLISIGTFIFMSALGAVREVLARGGLLLDAESVLGIHAAGLSIHLPDSSALALVVGLPTAGFIAAGIALAALSRTSESA